MANLAVWIAVLVAAAAPQSYVLKAGAAVWDVAVDDLNGDGRKDIYASCCDKEASPVRKFVAVFLADASNGYASVPSFTLDLDSRTGVLFLAETDGKPPKELITADSQSARVYQYANGRLELASETQMMSLFPSGSKEPMFLGEIARDLDKDGIDEWLVPVPAGFQVRTPAGPLCNVACDMVSEVRRGDTLYIYHRLPACHLFDLDGQGTKGIAFLSDEFADFAFGENWAEHKRFKIPVNVAEKWDATSTMSDIDGNGMPDLIVTQTKGTVNLAVLTQVYLAKAPFTYPDKPNATFEARGAMATPILKDVNGDGHTDLLFIKIPVGVKAFINYFIRQKVAVHVDVYLFKQQGFNPQPDYTQALTLDAPEGRQQVAYAMGDFNGDKHVDVALGSGANKVVVYAGADDRFLATKPWVSVDLPSFGLARSGDLNGDGKDDLILFHPGIDNKDRIEVVLFR